MLGASASLQEITRVPVMCEAHTPAEKTLGRGPSADFPTGCDITQPGPASVQNSGGRSLKGDACNAPDSAEKNGRTERGENFSSSACPAVKQTSGFNCRLLALIIIIAFLNTKS